MVSHHEAARLIPKFGIKQFKIFFSGAQRNQRPEELRKSKEIYTQIDVFNIKDMTETNYPPIRVVNSRHPFQRLYSAWNDKFSNRSSIDRQNKVLEEIQLFEMNGTEPDPGYTVTFNAFAEFVASVNREAYHNRHWQRISSTVSNRCLY